MNIVTVGVDLAKNVFALHGVDQSCEVVFGKARVQLLELGGKLVLCRFGVQA